ncbi:kunitz-type serine protease inhibitor 2-like [Drosophila madeirensis]|uniref:Kunitz-type serine protease inhibitor 2-like n=1 Tax=Drosophila madeirensis TaxID=30013 RepID=A0AAU9F6H0_DROMD|nr:kunitz-type serine protease inhibitor 2-like [Drosophila subobscura]
MFWMRLVVVYLAASLVYAKKEASEDVSDKLEKKKRFAICSMRPAYGNCGGHRLLFNYNIYRNECQLFVYSNCGGNQNRFHSNEQCMSYCNG